MLASAGVLTRPAGYTGARLIDRTLGCHQLPHNSSAHSHWHVWFLWNTREVCVCSLTLPATLLAFQAERPLVEALAGLERKGFSDNHVWVIKFSSKMDELHRRRLNSKAPAA